MNLPIPLDYPPMDAETAAAIPSGPEWQYEPKWDGFRCLAFRDGAEIKLESKAGQNLHRYFPEVVSSLAALEAKRFVLDGELILIQDGKADFDLLLQRIHPAESRIQKLSKTTPATFILFDLLVDDGGAKLTDLPLDQRREALERFKSRYAADNQQIRLSPYTIDFATAESWFHEMRGVLDGIIAKNRSLPYLSGERKGMRKIKNIRTADCVVGGFRYASKNEMVGSLLLGLYDDDGLLQHVGFTSAIKQDEKESLTKELEALIEPPGFTGAKPGGPSRWSTERSSEWQPLSPKLVVEVAYDHFSGRRFRHGTRLLRWRPDKKPSACTLAQVRFESQSPLLLFEENDAPAMRHTGELSRREAPPTKRTRASKS
jgi:ATP-dependent DNA ligase